ncbi:unnamed protein product [Prorocentrum cordatum]|uniref:Uncharacterized protein n=1 Tax=Prorocentrum cordatum TaxID=2364126 RepID=A0ABN9TW36_9DINO|nr:unnamed protein product [Polarella glacialis]
MSASNPALDAIRVAEGLFDASVRAGAAPDVLAACYAQQCGVVRQALSQVSSFSAQRAGELLNALAGSTFPLQHRVELTSAINALVGANAFADSRTTGQVNVFAQNYSATCGKSRRSSGLTLGGSCSNDGDDACSGHVDDDKEWTLLGDPCLAGSRKLQIVVGRFRDLGLLYPSEQTCTHVIAFLAEAILQRQPDPVAPSSAAVIAHTNDFKSLMRAVRKNVPSGNVPRVYPENPNELERTHPELFQKAFPADTRPVFPSPVDSLGVELLRRGPPCRISHSSISAPRRARRAPSGLQAALLDQAATAGGELPGLTICSRPQAAARAGGLLALADGLAHPAAAGARHPRLARRRRLQGPLQLLAKRRLQGVAARAPADAAANADRLARLRARAKDSSAPNGAPSPKGKNRTGSQTRSGTKKALKRPAAAKTEASPAKKARRTPPAQKGAAARAAAAKTEAVKKARLTPPAQKGAARRAATSFPGVPKRKTEATWIGDYRVYSDVTKQAWRARKPGHRHDASFSWKADPRKAWSSLVEFTTE